MSKLKAVSRKKLGQTLQKQQEQFKLNLFFTTSFRATKDNSIQVEVCQRRRLGGRKRTVLGMINRSDKRFSNDATLLFDWMTFQPKDLLQTFPELAKHYTVEDLQAIADSWKEDAQTGKEATVYAAIHTIPTIVDYQDGKEYTPVIQVTEVVGKAGLNEFYTGKDAEEKVVRAVENNAMMTSSDDDAEEIVSPDGEPVYRFARTMILEDNPEDVIVEGKMSRSAWEAKAARTPAATVQTGKAEDVLGSLLDQKEEI